MLYRNYTSHVLCGEVYYTVSLFGRVHYQKFYRIPNVHATVSIAAVQSKE